MNAAVGIPWVGLYNGIVRRLRWSKTIFGDNVFIDIRQPAPMPAGQQIQLTQMKPPYLVVTPTVTRVEGVAGLAAAGQVRLPHIVVLTAQLAETPDDWRAALEIEIAERQLIGALAMWQPHNGYLPAVYAGMAIENTRAPHVQVRFVFQFIEELVVAPDLDEDLCAALARPMEFPDLKVRVSLRFDATQPCEPPEDKPPTPGAPPGEDADPCADPCDPCAPESIAWSAAEWLKALGAKTEDDQ